jgi:hypothetical protein
MPTFIDLTGQRFERLTVVERTEDYISPKGKPSVQWKCRCECGKECVVIGSLLRRGAVKSCGCFRNEKIVKYGEDNPKYKHGAWKERLYAVWKSMITRCFSEKCKSYADYGGRGITVCDEWLCYDNFKKWAIANGYDPNAVFGKCTIDRIDNNGNYCPQNCRWVSMKVQSENKRRSKR